MHEPLEAGGLEAAAVELLHLGVDGDGEAVNGAWEDCEHDGG